MNFVVIVEDDDAVANRLSGILRDLGKTQNQIHRAASIADARQLFSKRSYALALIDIGLPDGSGIELLRWLLDKQPELSSVVISAWGTEDLILASLRAGAVGYLLKERVDSEILASLRSIEQGGSPIDPFVAKYILRLVSDKHLPAKLSARSNENDKENPEAIVWFEQLTPREQEILKWVAQGFISREIAERINRSKLTVECHIKSIYRKLHVSSRTEAVHQARTLGLLH